MYPIRPIDPVVTFRNSQGDAARGTLTNVQRRALVMEIYNPYSIVQVSEVLREIVVRCGDRNVYHGKGVVASLVNTGLVAVASIALVDEWMDLNLIRGNLSRVGEEATRFVEGWDERFRVQRSYQVAVSETRAFLAEAARWADQADLAAVLPTAEDGRLRADVFRDLATPIMRRGADYFAWLEAETREVSQDHAAAHHSFVQAALHPLLLRAPFVYRTFAKPLGYAGDYEMVNQILSDPQQGTSTYFQMVNALFLQAPVAEAHRNRIDILVDFLCRAAERSVTLGRPLRVLNVGCGPAMEIQRFISAHPEPQRLNFTLVDFSDPTLDYTRKCLDQVMKDTGATVSVMYVNESVHQLLKQATRPQPRSTADAFDVVYCAGLFDYLSDKVCARLLEYFIGRLAAGGRVMVSNVHASNPQKGVMEHVLEWHLIYRDEAGLARVLPAERQHTRLFTDATGVNVFAEFSMDETAKSRD